MKHKIFIFICFCLLVTACATPQKRSIGKIDDDIRAYGKEDIQRTVDMGPKPNESLNDQLETKRKIITSEQVRNYVTIPDSFENLKQKISINFNNLDFRYAMLALGEIGGINILVGDEITGTITAKLTNVPWDKAFNSVLDMKSFAADVDVSGGVIRIHSPDKLTQQETYKSQRADVLRKKIQTEESVEPVYSEIWRLYYITPAEAKKTLEDLFSLSSGSSPSTPAGGGIQTTGSLKITVENTTRSVIVRGRKADLDVVDKVIKEIDVRTKQVLIQAFVVDASDTFQRELGSRISARRQTAGGNSSAVTSGIANGNNTSSASVSGVTLGSVGSTVSNFPTNAASTSGIGIIRSFGANVLAVELSALEKLGLSKTISNPKVFTLNNKKATIVQGKEIAYQTTADGTTTTQFKEAALRLEVTPSVVGDGNILLDVKVTNDDARQEPGFTEPPIFKMEINTKLLAKDGDIVVIGGVKKTVNVNNEGRVPGVGNIPVIGNLFKNKNKQDDLNELLIFIATKVI
jgi:type IV pilus assembly protein PilQ